MSFTGIAKALAFVSLLSPTLAWEKTHNWKYLDAYPLVVQPDRLIQIQGNVTYPGPPSEGPVFFTTNATSIASCIVDYGASFTGTDFYNVAASSNNAILRITYSESLDFVNSGGDITYETVIQDHNTIRQRNYTLDTATTRIENYLPTTFRYTKLELLTPGVGSFRLGALVNSYAEPQPYIAGNFSGEGQGWLQNISKIFNYGAHTLSSTMLPSAVYNRPFRVGSGGAYLDDQTSGVFDSFPNETNYTISINAHIIKGGFGVRAVSDSVQEGFLWQVWAAGSERPNLIQLIYGKSEETGHVLGEATSSVPITEGDWWTFSFGIYNNNTGIASVNGTLLATIPVPRQIDGRDLATKGSYGLRTLQDQRVILANLTGFGANGRTLLNTEFQSAHNQMQVTAESVYFGQDLNQEDNLLSGSKNNRGVDIADSVVGARAMFHSWAKPEFILGNLHIFGANQWRDGRLQTWSWPQLPAKTFWPSSNTPPAFYFGFNYFTEFAILLKDYVMYTDDREAVTFTANEQYPSQFTSLEGNMAFIETYVDEATGLINIPAGSELGRDWAGWYNSTSPGYLPFEDAPTEIVGKTNILWYASLKASAWLAYEIQVNNTLGDHWSQLADKVYASVNEQLYDKEKHYYYISTDRTNGVAQDLNGMAILYGIAPIAEKQKILDTMSSSLYDDSKAGKYMSYTKDAIGYPYKAVPYAAYYHAAAAFEICDTNKGFDLIEQIWYPMIWEGDYFSKGYWNDLEPTAATDLVSSRSAGVLELLGGYVMGVKPTSPGHATYTVRPQMGALDRINGTSPTVRGGIDLDLRKSSSGALNWTITPSFYPSDATVFIPSQVDHIQINGVNVTTGGSASNLPWGVESVTKNTTDYTIEIHLTGTTTYNFLA